MPWNGAEFELLYDFVDDRNLGQPSSRISPEKVMEMFRDLADGLETSLNASGTNPPTDDYDWNGQRITNAGAATGPTDFVTAGQAPSVSYIGTVTQSDANTWTATAALVPTAIPTGYTLSARIATSNTDEVTLALNGGSAKDVLDRGGNALAAGDVPSDAFIIMQYDGTAWRIQTPVSSETAGGGTTGLTNVAAPLTGNGTTSALEVDFSAMSAADAQAVASALVSDLTASATLSGGLTGVPAIITCSNTAPTGAAAEPGCLWVRLSEMIVFLRINDGTNDIWLDISTPNGGTAAGPDSVSTGSIQDSAVSNAKLANMNSNTIKGNTSAGAGPPTDLTGAEANLLLNDTAAVVTYLAVNGTYTPDMSAGIVHDLTVNGTLAIAAPTNVVANQVVLFRIAQDATGGRTISWNSAYKWGAAGSPVMSTAGGSVDWAAGIVRSGSRVEMLSFVAGF